MPTKKIDQVWDDCPGGRLDADTIDRIDTIAQPFVDAVHSADVAAVERITRGMSWTHLSALALSVASLAEPSAARPPQLAWSIADLKWAHARYKKGGRTDRVRQGEALYQQMLYRHRAAKMPAAERRLA
ncbi:hypothetical protein SAMN05444374_11645 [Rhodococcoides kroppenstedtii]|uniref:Uncharacterized protein n=1 Tax=Rhodococcoides kroppenstedtii TaxID=293050 RepID=A0A1I0UC95_9NOCA|nr:hypothetical protein [Rhodococcus kroppenstedtii]SFA60866.1 hypothetical protein SAMN05444374_11645 [Rhodococcus kroppenstedtii]